MGKKKKKNRSFIQKLTDHYKILLVDSDTHEGVFELKLNVINGLLILAFFTIFIIAGTLALLKFSPIKTYLIPEKTNETVKYKNQLLHLTDRLTSLEDSLAANRLYIASVQAVVSGEIKAEKIDSLVARKVDLKESEEHLKASPKDSVFRAQVAQEELEALSKKEDKKEEGDLYFAPVQGVVTGHYDVTENHLATDIAAKKGESVKAVEKGDILFADWVPETGYTVIISHPNDVISMYKHCSKVFKKVGEEVQKGEAIAEVGESGEITTGPHLHFELWVQGKAVDPEEYIKF